MKFDVKTVIDNTASLLAAVKELRSQQVLVGVPAADTEREDEKQPITNAALAYIHNSGAPEANIPARPFMEPGLKQAQDRITGDLGDAGKAALEGNIPAVNRKLNSAGLVA